jgi:hypothetical protein
VGGEPSQQSLKKSLERDRKGVPGGGTAQGKVLLEVLIVQ